MSHIYNISYKPRKCHSNLYFKSDDCILWNLIKSYLDLTIDSNNLLQGDKNNYKRE